MAKYAARVSELPSFRASKKLSPIVTELSLDSDFIASRWTSQYPQNVYIRHPLLSLPRLFLDSTSIKLHSTDNLISQALNTLLLQITPIIFPR